MRQKRSELPPFTDILHVNFKETNRGLIWTERVTYPPEQSTRRLGQLALPRPRTRKLETASVSPGLTVQQVVAMAWELHLARVANGTSQQFKTGEEITAMQKEYDAAFTALPAVDQDEVIKQFREMTQISNSNR